ncbi:MAG: ATP-binding protein [Terriglobales bacterium]
MLAQSLAGHLHPVGNRFPRLEHADGQRKGVRAHERASTMLTSNRPVEDWGKLLGDAAAVSAMLDRLLHHGHVLKCGPRSWRTKTDLPPQEAAG